MIGGDAGHLIRTSALEVILLSVESHKVRVTRHHAGSVSDGITISHPLLHLALLPEGTTRLLDGQTSTGGAGVAFGAAIVAPEGGPGFHKAALEHTATLSRGDALGAAAQESIVTGARLHTGGVAFWVFWVCACSRTGTPTELIMAVRWTLWWSCVDTKTRLNIVRRKICKIFSARSTKKVSLLP